MADSYEDLVADASCEAIYLCQDDAASAEIIDWSGNNRDGLLMNAGTTSGSTTAGPNGWLANGIDLTGDTDYIQLPCPYAVLNAVTFALWVRGDVPAESQEGFIRLFGIRASSAFPGIWFRSFDGGWTDTFEWYWDQGSPNYVPTGIGYNVGEWTHVAMTYDLNAVNVYINGSLRASANQSGSAVDVTGGGFNLGADSVNRVWNGGVAGAHFFSSARSEAEIGLMMNGPAVQLPTPEVVISPRSRRFQRYITGNTPRVVSPSPHRFRRYIGGGT